MKKILLTVAALAFVNSQAQTSWSLDKSHTKLGFAVSHMAISETEGLYKKYDATIDSKTEKDFTDAKVNITIDAASITTEDENRDAHIKGPEYFDVAKYPTLTFVSTSFKKVKDNKYKVTGNLTLHGVTKVVVLDVTYSGNAISPYTKKTLAGFKFTTKIKRTDFGVATSVPAVAVGDEITISGSMEFIKN
jgi:polyisoprenoid-binding protein YceI